MAEEKKRMPEGKAKRIAIGATVAGVLLALFLIVVLIVQFVQMGAENRRIAKYNEEIRKLEELTERDQKNLDFYRTEQGLVYLASKEGWK